MLVCNRCLLFKSDSPDPNLLYHIGNCGHVFCSNCRQMYQGCFVCQNHEARFTAIDENLRADMKLILTSPEVLCRAFEQSLSFQNMHMTLFQDSTEQKINAMQKAVQVNFLFLKVHILKPQVNVMFFESFLIHWHRSSRFRQFCNKIFLSHLHICDLNP